MDYKVDLKYHYKPKKGWMNDPNGLVYFNGYYHAFYQFCPHNEKPWQEPMTWGHARTKDFLHWEELPVAIAPSFAYDVDGCWSGTAIVKDDTLYLFYASVKSVDTIEYGKYTKQTVSLATSKDGVHFEKCPNNPLIFEVPSDGREQDFRDPAVCEYNGKYYIIMATANQDKTIGRLLLYESSDLLNWKYVGVTDEYKDAIYCECPSFVHFGDQDKMLLASSVCYKAGPEFEIMLGTFDGKKYNPEIRSRVQKGPDQYAGQVFRDNKGRDILLTWVPGWFYDGFAERSLGCLSLPVELKLKNNRFIAYPIEEVRHLLKDNDELIERTSDGFIIRRQLRDDVIYKGEIHNLKVLKDEYLIEIFINDGEDIVIAILC